MNDSDKTFVFAFYNSFLKIELNCDKKSMLILNTCSFQRKTSNLTYVLIIYSLILTTDVCRKFCKTCRNIFMTEFTVKKVAVFRVATFLNNALQQIYFLGIYKIFNITNSTNLDCQM